MAQLQRKPVQVPVRSSGGAERAAGNARAAADRFELDRALIQFHFAPARPGARRWRAVGLLALLALAVAGAIAGVAYAAGLAAAGIAAGAVAALIGFGNWILNNIIEL